ncbi:MAG: hypothetical protein HWN66_10245 [Candidatus Helarchaeota archaeon]|nr:hypothetical protein [Candidatus Helarchaeota archaeon]
MKFLMRGTIAHIILQENTKITDIIQEIMVRPPEKYSLEVHLDRNREVVSIIIFDIGGGTEKIITILKFFIKTYEKKQDYDSIVLSFRQIIRELYKIKPIYPRNLFRFDSE